MCVGGAFSRTLRGCLRAALLLASARNSVEKQYPHQKITHITRLIRRCQRCVQVDTVTLTGALSGIWWREKGEKRELAARREISRYLQFGARLLARRKCIEQVAGTGKASSQVTSEQSFYFILSQATESIPVNVELGTESSLGAVAAVPTRTRLLR